MIKPYYQDDYVIIYHGDCKEILPELPKIDLVLTDPPYGVRDDSWDDKLEFNHFVQEWILRCIVVAPIVVWFGSGNRFKYLVNDKLHRILVWNKPAGSQFAGASHNNLWYSSELIFIYGNTPDIISKGKESSFGYSVFDARTVPEAEYGHPTSKPCNLIEWLLLHYSDKDDLILDPFLGSGTTAYCAKRLNRKCIGIEIEEKYCEIAANRCRQMVFKL